MAKWPDNPDPKTGDIPALRPPQQPAHRGDLSEIDLSRIGLPDENGATEPAPAEPSRFAPRPPGAAEPWRAPQPEPKEDEPKEDEPEESGPQQPESAPVESAPVDLEAAQAAPLEPAPLEPGPLEAEPREFAPDEDDDRISSEPWNSGFDAFADDEDDAPLPPVRPKRDALSNLRIGARAVAGTVGIGIAAAAIAAATWLPLPQHAPAAPSMLVTPTATTQQRVCPGPALRMVDAIDANASAISSAGQPDVTAASAKGAARQSMLTATENSSAVAPVAITLPASANAALAGSQSQLVPTGGFAAAECAETAAETWLVGGATDTGRTTLITLSNPGAVPATVSVTVFTENGEVRAAGSEGIVVPGGSQRILPLAGFAPNVLSPVVRVTSAGGQVVANLQHRVVRTLASGGLAIVGASAPPATHLVIPGVVLTGTEALAAQQSSPGFADIAPVLRLYVPGTAAAKVQIAIIPEDGSAPDEPSSLSVPGGVVTDLPIEAGDGSFTIGLSADIPVIAAARVSVTGSSGAADLTWFAAAPVLHERSEVAVAAGPSPMLHLANPTEKSQTVTLESTDASTASPTSVSVPASASVTVPVASGGYLLSGFDSLRVAVSYQGDGQLSAYTVSPGAPSAPPIRVYP
ncbi:hypothetical protein GCM10027052_02720 [Parafrigoribacterium mesophilum]|uniref:DUF5719 family protein n=1 Tax=Parafrigoribacterium mesophilum TaxID=433646 RepID=UPI0031FC5CDE